MSSHGRFGAQMASSIAIDEVKKRKYSSGCTKLQNQAFVYDIIFESSYGQPQQRLQTKTLLHGHALVCCDNVQTRPYLIDGTNYKRLAQSHIVSSLLFDTLKAVMTGSFQNNLSTLYSSNFWKWIFKLDIVSL